MSVTIKTPDEPFLKYLNPHKRPHIIVTAEDDDFDEITIENLRGEGFNVQYVPMRDDSPSRYSERLHATANSMTGVNEYYAIVAYGDAAGAILETHTKAVPRLICLIVYYPSTIPDPARTSWPMGITVLMHLAGGEIGVRRNQELLGIQGKRKTVRKRMARGLGMGGEMKLGCTSYKYEGVEPGFAEHDLEDHDPIAEDLAWSRTLRTLREAFGLAVDLEKLRDQQVEDIERDLPKAIAAVSDDAAILCVPTTIGSTTAKELDNFYRTVFRPSPQALNPRLISRTIGVNRVVDEISLSFTHDTEIPWLLPRIPPTNKQIQLILISIVCVKSGCIVQERMYWDQASVLLQAGLLDVEQVPQTFQDAGVQKLPVIGAESSRIVQGHDEKLNLLLDN